MGVLEKFKISSALKDIIGRDLITNDFVAIFELVKNSFDAHATQVEIEFEHDSITIVDDGKGMSRDDLVSKWLFVAYSAKRTGEEDANLPRDYRDAISQRRGYAGNKGIGRFSCDRLGELLDLYSKSVNGNAIEHLHVDWTTFEQDAKKEFATIDVELEEQDHFPPLKQAEPQSAHGTVLIIRRLRDRWDQDKIGKLRSYLAKLIDPFQTTPGVKIVTYVADRFWPSVEGNVGNQIIDLLNDKTARLHVIINNGRILTDLWDRGVLIYRIEEENPYPELNNCHVESHLYFLNRSAKATFTGRMGVQPVQFGNVFLFVNGFRIYPIGEPTDDTFGIARRKQQGVARYLGLRDVLGKIDVQAPVGMFREASSRDAGLIDTQGKAQLYDAFMEYVLKRLERYVVTVNWADSLDQERDDPSGLKSDSARARIIRVVTTLAGSKKVKLLDYDHELVDIINERASEFEESMEGLSVVAEQTGDQSLLERLERARQRFAELKQAEAEAKQRAEEETKARQDAESRAREAEQRAAEAGDRLERVEKQAKMLLNAQGRDNEELQLLHHQVVIYAVEVQALARRSLRKLSTAGPQAESIKADLEQISFQNSRILAVTRLATQANFKLKADQIEADIIQYMREYSEKVATLYGDVRTASFEDNGLSLVMPFRPIDISIVLDNLFSNAGKADASAIRFVCRKAQTGGAVEIAVSDDGRGINGKNVDTSKIFERGYSGSARGSGLGLYHIKQVLNDIGGSIALDPDRKGDTAQFIIRLPKAGGKAT